MENKEIIEIIRNMNGIYNNILYGKEYRYGCDINVIISHFREVKVFQGFNKIFELLRRRYVNRRLCKGESAEIIPYECNCFSFGYYAEFDLTVYTCIVNNYERLKDPIYPPQNYKYIAYTDNVDELKSDIWEIRQIPGKLNELKDAFDINRYVKMHPKEFVDTRYAMYVDGNVRTITHVDELIKEINEKYGLALYSHPLRNCAYVEARACKALKKGIKQNIDNQINRYKKRGFPHNYGLAEATIIVSDTENTVLTMLLSKWWTEYLHSKSKRDQLSFPYVLWKNGIDIDEICTLGRDKRRDNRFQITISH